MQHKGIIIYYSYGGNTKQIANMIKDQTNFELLELTPKVPYTTNYQQFVDDEKEKMNTKEIIEINDVDIEFNDYDKIIIGTPVWWYSMSPVIRSFLEKKNLPNKKVDIFITNGGWLGHTVEDFEEYLPINSYIDIKFNGNDLETPKEEIKNWIYKLQ